MLISDKAALNAVVRAVRQQLVDVEPTVFASLKFNTLHQIFARLCGFRTQAALLAALPSDLHPDPSLTEVELFRTWSLDKDADREVAVTCLAQTVIDLVGDGKRSNYALVQIDLLFGVSPMEEFMDEPIEDDVEILQVDWRSVIEASTGLNVKGGISARSDSWESRSFAGREQEFADSLSGKPLNVAFHEFVDMGIAPEDPDSEVFGYPWGPNFFTRSCLLFLCVEGLQSDDVTNHSIDSASSQNIRETFKVLDMDRYDGDDPYGGVGAHLVHGRVSVLEFALSDGLDDDDDSETDGNNVLTDQPDSFLAEFLDDQIEYLSVDEISVGFQLMQWGYECFAENAIQYPAMGISLVSGGHPVGFVGRWSGDTILGLQGYEHTPAPDAMSNSSNHIFGPQFFAANPETKLFFFDCDDIEFYMQHMDSVAHLVNGELPNYIYPALLGKFSETFKHLPEGIDRAYDPNRPAFEVFGPKLISEHGADCVKVDDFLNPFDDMSSAIIVGLYRGDDLVAEFSYSVLKQNPKDTACAELEMDAVIKEWAGRSGLPLLWNEHAVLRPTGPRELSHFRSESAFLPLAPSKYMLDSTLCAVIEFEEVSPFAVERQQFQKAMTDLFEHCVTNVEPFDFRLLSEAETNLLPESATLKDLVEVVAAASKKESSGPVYVLPGMNFLGGYNLRGTSKSEKTRSVSNTWRAKFEYDENGTPVMKPEVAKTFLESLGVKNPAGEIIRVNFLGFSPKRIFKGW
jgi:hypothetical protein